MLSSETVAKIKAYIEQGQRVGEIASAYDVSRQTIAKIASGRTHTAVLQARSVPQLSKEAERVQGAKRLEEAAKQRLQERAERQQEEAELKQQTGRKIWEAEESRREAERQVEELKRQVAKLTPQPAPAAPAASAAPEHAPDAERPHSLAGLGLSEILPLMDIGQLPADSLQKLMHELRPDDIVSLLDAAREKVAAPDEPTRRLASQVVNAAHVALRAERAAP